MLIRHASDIRSSEITDQKLYVNRREFIRALTVTAAAGAGLLAAPPLAHAAAQPAPHGRMVALIDELSEISKLDTGTAAVHEESFDLFGLVQEVADSVHAVGADDVK